MIESSGTFPQVQRGIVFRLGALIRTREIRVPSRENRVASRPLYFPFPGGQVWFKGLVIFGPTPQLGRAMRRRGPWPSGDYCTLSHGSDRPTNVAATLTLAVTFSHKGRREARQNQYVDRTNLQKHLQKSAQSDVCEVPWLRPLVKRFVNRTTPPK